MRLHVFNHANDHHLHIFSSLSFSHFLQKAYKDSSRQFFVRKQAQVILTVTMHDVGIRYVDLGQVAIPTALLHAALYLVFFVRGRPTCVIRLCCRFHRHACSFRRRRCGL